MRELASAVVWRYAALGIQFLIVVLIARHASLVDAGHYFAIFGGVAVTAVAAGFGVPDGAVRKLPAALARGEIARAEDMARAGLTSSVASVAVVAVGVTTLAVAVGSGSLASLSVVAWWFSFSLVVIGAQFVTGLGHAGAGAFLGYSVTNVFYLVSTVPYVMLADDVTLTGLLVAASAGTTCAALLSCVFVAVCVLRLRPAKRSEVDMPSWRTTSRKLLAVGMPMTAARVLQGALPWIPVWALTVLASAQEAGLYAVASRLVVAAAAPIAAIRFAVRPQVVRLWVARSLREIGRLARWCSAAAAILPALGIVLLLATGDRLLVSVLGAQYAASQVVLIVLLVGVLGEAAGGISDEILKMTGSASFVLVTVAGCAMLQVIGCLSLGSRGATAVAGVTVLAFCAQYALQLQRIWHRTEITIWWRSSSEKGRVR